MVMTESSLNLIRGPAKRPEWAQLIRLGGDRVAVLFDELRKAVGKIDGIVERLHFSAGEGRWVVQYSIGGSELFTARILPGSLEALMPLAPSEAEKLIEMPGLGKTFREVVRTKTQGGRSGSINLLLKDNRIVRSFANLVRAKSKLARQSDL